MKKYYISAHGTEDGSSAESCGGDIAIAASALASGGEIIIVGEYDISTSVSFRQDGCMFVMPLHRQKITIRGFDRKAVIKVPRSLHFASSGELEFANIKFWGTGDLYIAARYYPLTIDNGVSIHGFNTSFVIGGCNATVWAQEKAVEKDTNITVKSGNFTHLIGFDRALANTTYLGTARITLDGGTISNGITGISGHNNTAYTGNRYRALEVTVKSGYAARINDMDTSKCGFAESFKLTLYGGEVTYAFAKNAGETVIEAEKEDDESYKRNKSFFCRKIVAGVDGNEKKTRILCVGDSITEGCGASDQDKYSYPAQLAFLLGTACYDICNASRGGTCVLEEFGNAFVKTDHFIKSLSYNPDIVLLMIGTNDNIHLYENESNIKKFEEQYDKLIKTYLSLPSKPKVYVLSATVRTDIGARVKTLEKYLLPIQKNVAAQNGCDFVDMHALTSSAPWLMPENLHPGDITYGYMASYLCRLIKGETTDYLTKAKSSSN